MSEDTAKPAVTAYLGLGTNLGDKEANLRAAVHEIQTRIGEVTSLSSFYATEPWGFTSPNTFLNAACAVLTTLTPGQLLQATQAIERDLGRTRKSVAHQYADRVIDIDILLYGSEEVHLPGLDIPHPLMHERDFVMKPLREIYVKKE
jgi:2-amino-4-hydroxy-6-hydroxymethyldihydropteridine diphosphokinase